MHFGFGKSPGTRDAATGQLTALGQFAHLGGSQVQVGCQLIDIQVLRRHRPTARSEPPAHVDTFDSHFTGKLKRFNLAESAPAVI